MGTWSKAVSSGNTKFMMGYSQNHTENQMDMNEV